MAIVCGCFGQQTRGSALRDHKVDHPKGQDDTVITKTQAMLRECARSRVRLTLRSSLIARMVSFSSISCTRLGARNEGSPDCAISVEPFGIQPALHQGLPEVRVCSSFRCAAEEETAQSRENTVL